MSSPPVTVDIFLDRASGTYKLNEYITGQVGIRNLKAKLENFGFILKAQGKLTLQNQSRNKNLEALGGSVKPIMLFRAEDNVTNDKFITPDNSNFSFKFRLESNCNEKLLESYIGVYISVEYEITVEFKSAYAQIFKNSLPFFVQIPEAGKNMILNFSYPRPLSFTVKPQGLIANSGGAKIPNFRISGTLGSDICYMSDELGGFFVIEECESQVKSVDLQLVRMENVENKYGRFSEATEIQLIQIGEGDLARRVEIPLFMIFPKYFSCPNFNYKDYEVRFEVNFIMILVDGFKITQNFPFYLVRLPVICKTKTQSATYKQSSMRKSPKLSLKITPSMPSGSLLPNPEAITQRINSLAQIDDSIYIGSYEDACDYLKLRDHKITDIINCSPLNCPNNYTDEFTYFNFDLCDTQDFELWAPMSTIIKLLQKLKADGRKVLVHCYQGISRAPSIAIGYLIQCEDRNVEDAIKQVKTHYIKADPNIGFMIQLEQYYNEMHQKRGSL